MIVFVDFILVLIGLLLLVWGADRFVGGASGLARSLGVSTLVIGLTVVSLGTSAPELLVNITAQVEGVPAMAFGNVVGSNIANIGLVMGVAALVLPLSVHSQVLRREYPVLLGMTVLLGAMVMDGQLDLYDGALLTLALVAYTTWTLKAARSAEHDPFVEEAVAEIPEAMPTWKSVLWLLVGLAALVLGSRALVSGASDIAGFLGVSDLVIGLTVVAFGTSLPELAASLAAVAKKEDDLVVGNVVGSCLLNILVVLGLPALFGTIPAGSEALWRDLPVLLVLTLVLGPLFLNGRRGHYRVSRTEGGVLVAAYAGYVGWVFASTVG
ncbi:MAG TPA: calcium/sodium antiporter [Gammaproteobacteria bacterium]|nr:calcium/sodium antiporter [Gammaproteobacteria bacterium]